MKPNDLLEAAAKRLAQIRETCHEGEVLSAMVEAAAKPLREGRSGRLPAIDDMLASAKARLASIADVMVEGLTLSAMIEAGEKACEFIAPIPHLFECELMPGEQSTIALQFPVNVRAFTYSVQPTDADAFEVIDLTIGLCCSLFAPVPATELTGNMPINLHRPEEGQLISYVVPGFMRIKNTSKRSAKFAVSFRVKILQNEHG